MLGSRRSAVRKRVDRYHHGNLRQALLQEAAATIQARGVEGLTLRAVGERLGVSRTALYRHFADKATLLAAVAQEGFVALRTALETAFREAGGGREGLDAMATAYVHFAVSQPSYYRVMFGGFVDASSVDPDCLGDAPAAAFQVLVEALAGLQAEGVIRRDEPDRLARFVWATVHGVAMLGIDGQLEHQGAGATELIDYTIGRLRAALAPDH